MRRFSRSIRPDVFLAGFLVAVVIFSALLASAIPAAVHAQSPSSPRGARQRPDSVNLGPSPEAVIATPSGPTALGPLFGGTIPIPPTQTSTATATLLPGQPTPTITVSPTSTATVAPLTTQYVATPGTVATFVSNNGQVSVAIPADFVSASGPETVSVDVFPTGLAGNQATVDAATPLLVLELDLAVNGTPTSGTPFADPITVSFRYDPLQVADAGLDPANLKIYLVSSDGRAVTGLPTTVDEGNDTVTATIPHLTQVVLAAPHAVLFIPDGPAAATAGW